MLKIDHLKKNYGSFRLDCSLEVSPGCITGLVGPNGSGKSTTFKSVLGLVRIDEGSVKIFGRDLCDLSTRDRENIGVVLSDSGFSNYLNIKDILPIMNHFYRNFDRNTFVARCRRFQLPFDKKLKDFSTGMKAQLKILLALSHRAQLIILDEPTAGQDFHHYTEIMEFLRGLNEQGVTVVMITHDMHLMLEYTPRALVFSDGQLIADRRASEVLCDPELIERAALKETSLFTLANQCEITPPEAFVERFIGEDREVRSNGR